MTTKARITLISELVKTSRAAGQLLFKCVYGALQKNPICNPASMPILKVLLENGPMSQHAIAREVHHADASVSRQIKLLVDKGYVSAKTDPGNRKVAIISLTTKGRKALKEIEQAVLGYLATLLAPLSDKKLMDIIRTNIEFKNIIISHTKKHAHG